MNLLKSSLLLLSVLFIMTVSAEAAETKDLSTITVQGASTLEVTPDQAVISIGITNSAPSVSAVQTANAKVASLVQEKLLDAGITKEKIRTTQYSISPIYTNATDNTKPPTITGYQADNTISVTIDDITAIGTIIDTAAGAGANQISGIQFEKKDELKLKQTVLQNSVQEASAKAEALAKALNKQIVRVISVNENGVSVQSPSHNTRYEMSLKAVGATPIQPGCIQVHGTVTIVFEIQ
ncbi:MAG: SIMPL domain-containing protein [Pelosinus sp.]|nr:SIMPL domain-containing protein [Pelosinus sp.]